VNVDVALAVLDLDGAALDQWDPELLGRHLGFVSQTVELLDGTIAENIARMTWYVVDKDEYMAAASEIGVVYREIIGRHYPAMTVVEVSGLIEAEARVEIEVTAVVPE